MYFNKKAISGVIVVVLLLVVGIVSYIYLQNWFVTYKSDIDVKINSKDISKSLEIIKIESTDMLLKNDYVDNLIISSIKIGGTECINKNYEVDIGLAILDIGSCTVNLESVKAYDVAIITDYGIYNGVETIRAPVTGPLVVRFIMGQSCGGLGSGYYRLYGLTGLDNAHADTDGSSTYSLCLRHLDYNISASGYAFSNDAFYLNEQNNSAVFTSQGSILVNPSQWFPATISSNGNVDVVVNSSDMTSSGYSCIGKIDEDNVYGSHIGDCSSGHADGLWLKIG